MTIYSLLIQDHESVEKIFKKIELLKKNFSDEKEKKLHKQINDLFRNLKSELLLHSKAEEDVFYSPLAKDKKAHDLILEGKEEHSIVEKLLKELDDFIKYDAKWFAKLHELKEIVEHHVKEEESKIFKIAKTVFSKEDEKKIGEDFEKRKETFSTHSGIEL